MIENFETINIDSLKQYRELTKKLNYNYIFRGEPENETCLTSSLGRMFDKLNYENINEFQLEIDNIKKENIARRKLDKTIEVISGKDILQAKIKTFRAIEKEMFNTFKFEVSEFSILSKDDIFNLVLAQHHGLKTRLLDWTKDPFVALFFALGKNPNSSAFIYAYKVDKIFNEFDLNQREEYEGFYDFFNDKNETQFLQPPKISKRIGAQSAIIQLLPKPEESFIKYKYIDKSNFHCYKINKGKIHKEIKSNLTDYKYNMRTLFPDIDHLTKFINLKKLKSDK